MREFKFRVWVSKKKKMVVIPSILNPSWSESEDLGGYIMQYTGLEDVDENPIYEGDIVKVTSISYGNVIGRVVYSNGCFWVYLEKKKWGERVNCCIFHYELRSSGMSVKTLSC